jgi:hypothetical protein
MSVIISGPVDRSTKNTANRDGYLFTDFIEVMILLGGIARRDVTTRVHVPAASCRL